MNAYKGYGLSNHSFAETFDNACVHKDLGIALLTGDGVACADFDNCVLHDSKTGLTYLHPQAKLMIEELGAYSEYSYSVFSDLAELAASM